MSKCCQGTLLLAEALNGALEGEVRLFQEKEWPSESFGSILRYSLRCVDHRDDPWSLQNFEHIIHLHALLLVCLHQHRGASTRISVRQSQAPFLVTFTLHAVFSRVSG